MRFDLLLYTGTPYPVLPVDYHYLLSSAIRRILVSADQQYTTHLKSRGDTELVQLKNFKHFTFSGLSAPFQVRKQELIVKNNTAHLIIAFHLPDSAEDFIRNLLINKEIEITDGHNQVNFIIQQVKTISFLPASSAATNKKKPIHILLRPLSPLVLEQKNERGILTYLPPDHPSFIYQLLSNWKQTYSTIYPKDSTDILFNRVEVKYVPGIRPYRLRQILLHAGTKEEIQIIGFERFTLHASAPAKVLELAGNTGLGLYNRFGMGCMETKGLPERRRKL